MTIGVVGGGGRAAGPVTRGVKFLVVCGLALAMSVLALFVAWLTSGRSDRAATVRQEVGAEAGGPQEFLGPVVLVPCTVPNADPVKPAQRSVLVFAPTAGRAHVAMHVEERRRSLYRVPVMQSEVTLESDFAAGDMEAQLPAGATPEWTAAAIGVGVRDARAALSDAVLETPEGRAELRELQVPHEIGIDSTGGAQGQGADNGHRLAVLGVSAAHLEHAGAFQVKAHLRFRGAERATVLAYARNTTVEMEGNWPDPGFAGPVPPQQRQVTKQGFAASWFVPQIARGVAGVVDVAAMRGLGATAMTTGLVEVADAYQSVERALEYAPLFLGLVFLTYFLFEMTAGRPMHLAQYVLVGLAQLVFYLLLLSFAERIGFDWSFALGGGATLLLLSLNAGWVFQSAVQRWRALGVFGTLYAMIYCLLRMEDNALLIGALGSFVAIAAALYWTRRLDWYGAGPALADGVGAGRYGASAAGAVGDAALQGER